MTDTIILSTAWLDQPAMGQRPPCTLLIGAAMLIIRQRFGQWSFDLQADSTTITDNRADTMTWLAERLQSPARLLLWRAEDVVVPSLIAAAETARDGVTGARLLTSLHRALTGEVVDVAEPFGAEARSFDAVAHRHGCPFMPMFRADLVAAHRDSHHGAIRQHLATRAKTTWRLWLAGQNDADELVAATDAWLATPDAEVRLGR